MGRRHGAAIVALTALLEAALAARRALSADEALYVCAARALPRWPIADHPPLLGALLALARAPTSALPTELRTRAVSIVLGALSSLAIATLAEAWTEDASQAPRTFAIAATLASVGLMPFAGALLTTPDAPMLAAFAGCCVAVDRATRAAHPTPRAAGAAVALLASLAVMAKVAALALLLPMAASIALERKNKAYFATAAALLVGALAPLALAPVRRSLALQAAHALGGGPLVSAPYVGPAAALAALAGAQLALWGPAVAWMAASSLRRLPRWWRAAGASIALLSGASAVASGRPPEPGWLGALGVGIFAAAAIALAPRAPRLLALVVASAAAPALVALALWSAPVAWRGPLARVPPHAAARDGRPTADERARWTEALRTFEPRLPRYVPSAWSCAYAKDGEELLNFGDVELDPSTTSETRVDR